MNDEEIAFAHKALDELEASNKQIKELKAENAALKKENGKLRLALDSLEAESSEGAEIVDELRKENEELKAKDTGLSARMAYETYKSKYGVTNYNCLEAIEKILDELYPPHSEDSE